MKHIKTKSLEFNEKVFGNIFHRKRHLDAKLKGIYRDLDLSYDHELAKFDKELQRQYNHVIAQ